MKKLMFLLPFFLLSFHLMAQSPVTIGPKVAYNFNKLSDSNKGSDIDYAYARTWSYGLFFRGSFGKFYLQPEAYFNTKGSNLEIKSDPLNPSTQNISGQVRLTSLDVPLLLGYKIVGGNESLSNFRVFTGPVASFILKERRNDLNLLSRDSYSFNKYNIGVQAGIGFDVGFLTFDARYETGLNRINSNFNQRANSIQLSLGIKLL
ncbi:porin family protein [Rhodocytophaga aerolata]|uniref:Porin family protein n=1 Tax=Rhodocytophaga aerolata TaxID=455078 RepID=A0ABT8RF31_9BACT|nr:porin family protein [Rhodocytophaga aerolata]MDO1450708.1 porin family protein [Rhodocytophaga aerolata]